MIIQLLRKVISFPGVFLCLNSMCCQHISVQVVPASGPLALDGQITICSEDRSDSIGYQWEGPNFFAAHNAHINGLAPGLYCVTVIKPNQKDHYSCKYLPYVCPDIPFGIQVKQPTPGNADGALLLQLPKEKQTNFGIKWNIGDTTKILNNLKKGYYHLTITNNAGCSYYPGIHLLETAIEKTKTVNQFRAPPTKKLIEVVHLGVRPATSFGAVRKLAITALYPNPLQEQHIVEIESPECSWITMVLRDGYRRHVFQDLRFASTGNNRFRVHFPVQLPKGLYILSVTDNTGSTQYQKIIHLPRSAIP